MSYGIYLHISISMILINYKTPVKNDASSCELHFWYEKLNLPTTFCAAAACSAFAFTWIGFPSGLMTVTVLPKIVHRIVSNKYFSNFFRLGQIGKQWDRFDFWHFHWEFKRNSSAMESRATAFWNYWQFMAVLFRYMPIKVR